MLKIIDSQIANYLQLGHMKFPKQSHTVKKHTQEFVQLFWASFNFFLSGRFCVLTNSDFDPPETPWGISSQLILLSWKEVGHYSAQEKKVDST